eukprot:TRINITY_DN4228_c0_g1_i1.p1 TRINITY_DN4228_c0_g1~~TRINITY_DN4228_c0_g1_i1.p1  ORF type:complete len:123 (+),score=10.47 TRINITY_DN4228_c0_g1_i1:18-386(+)
MTRQTVLLFALAFVLLAVVLRHYAAIGVFPQDHVKFTWHQFHQALRDAADAEPHEIYPNLTPVTSDTLSVTTFGYERGFARFQQGASVTMNQVGQEHRNFFFSIWSVIPQDLIYVLDLGDNC